MDDVVARGSATYLPVGSEGTFVATRDALAYDCRPGAKGRQGSNPCATLRHPVAVVALAWGQASTALYFVPTDNIHPA